MLSHHCKRYMKLFCLTITQYMTEVALPKCENHSISAGGPQVLGTARNEYLGYSLRKQWNIFRSHRTYTEFIMKKKEKKSAYQRQSLKQKSQITGMNVYFSFIWLDFTIWKAGYGGITCIIVLYTFIFIM